MKAVGCLQDDRADVLMAVHTCILTHFAAAAAGAAHEHGARPASSGTSNGHANSSTAGNGALNGQAEVATAHAAAIKVRTKPLDCCSCARCLQLSRGHLGPA